MVSEVQAGASPLPNLELGSINRLCGRLKGYQVSSRYKRINLLGKEGGLAPALAFIEMTVEETLRDLVAIDSVSQRSNAEIVSYLATRCLAARLNVTRFPYSDDTGLEKTNLVAQTSAGNSTVKADSTVELALVEQSDTV